MSLEWITFHTHLMVIYKSFLRKNYIVVKFRSIYMLFSPLHILPKIYEFCFLIGELRMIHIHENQKSSMSWPTLYKGIWKWHCLYNNWHTLNAKTHKLNLFLNNLIWLITKKKNTNQSQIRKDKIELLVYVWNLILIWIAIFKSK